MVRSAPPKRDRREPPSNLTAYRLTVGEEELVVFIWESQHPAAKALSDAERIVLQLVVAGKSNAAIAQARGTSVRTVANQVASLLRKLGARSRYDLIGRVSAEPERAPDSSEP